jgi:tRNA-splicing endonuclease subunit Sen15, fungi type
MIASSHRPTPSALSSLISNYTSASITQSNSTTSNSGISNGTAAPTTQYTQNLNLDLPLEILHNLQHQHSWTDLRLHTVSPGTKLVDVSSLTPSTAAGNTTKSVPDPSILAGSVRSRSRSRSPSPSTLHSSSPHQQRHQLSGSAASEPVYLISGLPPRHAYIHPDFQAHLIRRNIPVKDVVIQREYVLPLGLNEKFSLKKLSGVFDALSKRAAMELTSHTCRGAGDVDVSATSTKGNGIGNGKSKGEEDVELAGDEGATSQKEGTNDATQREDLGINWTDAKRVLMGMVTRSGKGGGGDGTVVYYVVQEGEVKPRQNG